MCLYVLEIGLCIREEALRAHGLHLESFSFYHLNVMYSGQEKRRLLSPVQYAGTRILER